MHLSKLTDRVWLCLVCKVILWENLCNADLLAFAFTMVIFNFLFSVFSQISKSFRNILVNWDSLRENMHRDLLSYDYSGAEQTDLKFVK